MSKSQNKPIIKNVSFEESLDIINQCINKRKYRWTLSALNYIDFDDVAQILRLHIWKKWHLYDQSRKLESWLTVIINNQMINLLRNLYGNFSRPCLKCEFNEGGDGCLKFGTQNTSCDLFKAWTFGKKTKHDIQLSLPIENHTQEVYDLKSNNIDVDRTALDIHVKMKAFLNDWEYKVYDLLFIQHKTEEEIGRLLQYKSTEAGRNPGYKQISNIRKKILVKIKEMLKNGDIEIVN